MKSRLGVIALLYLSCCFQIPNVSVLETRKHILACYRARESLCFLLLRFNYLFAEYFIQPSKKGCRDYLQKQIHDSNKLRESWTEIS